MWTILWHEDLGNSDPWQEWYLAENAQVRARHDVVFDYLLTRQAHEWRKPFAKRFEGDSIEITIHTNVQHRLLGIYGPGKMQFSVLVACTHKGPVYNPKDAKKTLKRRIREFRDNPSEVMACERPKRS